MCVQVPLPAGQLLQMDCLLHDWTEPLADGCFNQREALHVQSLSHWAPANIGPYSQALRVSLEKYPQKGNYFFYLLINKYLHFSPVIHRNYWFPNDKVSFWLGPSALERQLKLCLSVSFVFCLYRDARVRMHVIVLYDLCCVYM